MWTLVRKQTQKKNEPEQTQPDHPSIHPVSMSETISNPPSVESVNFSPTDLEGKRKRNPVSWAWKYVERSKTLNDKGKLSGPVVAICLQPKCKWKQQMARDGSASNVKRHLWTTHSDLLTTAEREENPKSGQSTLDSSLSMTRSKRITDNDFKRILTHYVTVDGQPFTAVEDVGFRYLITALRPELRAWSADTITRCSTVEFANAEKLLSTKLSHLSSAISITVDAWTSDVNNKAFLGVTGHWIDNQWKLQHIVLDFADITTFAHTGENLATEVYNILETRHVTKKVSSMLFFLLHRLKV